ncbi:MAG TPA: class I SAM-dependent methyltransferase [Kofleriaceae bacterium]|nr:class I SAM-dependent methyltransferase [Kofleriaceae bacterium]
MTADGPIQTAGGDVAVTALPAGDGPTRELRDFVAADMFSIINGHALANALFALAESPLLGELEAAGAIDLPRAIDRHGLVERHALGLLRYLATQGLFEEQGGQVFAPTARGRAALGNGGLGLLQMYRGGYGELMARAAELMRGEVRYGQDLVRDGHWVARGSSKMTHAILDDVPYQVLERKGLRRIADLGCGAGAFLIDFVRRDPTHAGVGVDINPAAIELASQNAREAGVADRARFVVGDCFDLEVLAAHCRDVDAFYAFGMEHEHLRDGDAAVLQHIDGMAEVFGGKSYLLGEPMLHMTAGDGMFYWIHILSLQGMPMNVPGWSALLGKLRRARLREVFVPDHQRFGAYFDIAL